MQPTLLVLAAGMGSRYGGLKQMDGVGPNGEIIMDYSIMPRKPDSMVYNSLRRVLLLRWFPMGWHIINM